MWQHGRSSQGLPEQPVSAVFHASGVLADFTLPQQTASSLRRVWAPKMGAAAAMMGGGDARGGSAEGAGEAGAGSMAVLQPLAQVGGHARVLPVPGCVAYGVTGFPC